MVNSFRVSFNRVSAYKPGAQIFGPENVGIPNVHVLAQFLADCRQGAFTIGTPLRYVHRHYGLWSQRRFHDRTWIASVHVGGSLHVRSNGIRKLLFRRSFTIGSTTGLGLSDSF